MKLKGINKLRAKLGDVSAKTEKGVKDAVKVNANEIAANAIRKAPKLYQYSGGGKQPVNGEIGQSISTNKVTPLKWRVSVNSKMAAYAEFGTGAYVDVPQGWEDIAWSYYVNGKGLMLPTPYFYPAWREGQKRFLNDLQTELNRIDI